MRSPVDSDRSIGHKPLMTSGNPPEQDRADKMLVALGHFESRAAARAAIEAGLVSANGKALTKSSDMLARDARIAAAAAHPYVSRGGVKLAFALDEFGIDPAGRTCLDVGASTGGFTDVLLRRGAERVIAVDVGRGQLHPSIAADPRVTSLESLDARALTPAQLGVSPSLVVCDASFISLSKLLAAPLSLAAAEADLVALFKPQFEVGRDHVGKGGIVKDGAAVAAARTAIKDWLRQLGWPIRQWADSPITGGDGNREALLHARHRPQ